MRLAVMLAVSLAALLAAGKAHAQIAVAVDGNVLDDPAVSGTGEGAVGRFGYRFGFPRQVPLHFLILQPEAALGYARLPTAGPQVDVGYGTVGGRVGVLGFPCAYLEPFLFARYGLAFGAHGPLGAAELGAALDWRLPWASIGLHVGHTRFDAAGTTWPYLMIGPHFEARWFP